MQQIEDDTGLNANNAWRIAHDRKSWRALRPVAGQAFHWLTDWLTDCYYVTFGLWHEPSVCRLSVTLLHPGRKLNFSAIFLHRLIAQGLGQFVLKFWVNIQTGSRGSCKINARGMKNWRFSTNISLYFENGERYGHSCNRRRIGTRTRSIEWCHFQWLSMTPNIDSKVTIFWTSNNSEMVHDVG